MPESDRLLQLLIEFFELHADSRPEDIRQEAIAAWDSLAMVQLIAELERTFGTGFELDEIAQLRSYEEIHAILAGKESRDELA